jgi:hypothetical protein
MARPKSNKVRMVQTSVLPDTVKRLELERERTGESIGMIIDRLVKKSLPNS